MYSTLSWTPELEPDNQMQFSAILGQDGVVVVGGHTLWWGIQSACSKPWWQCGKIMFCCRKLTLSNHFIVYPAFVIAPIEINWRDYFCIDSQIWHVRPCSSLAKRPIIWLCGKVVVCSWKLALSHGFNAFLISLEVFMEINRRHYFWSIPCTQFIII